MIFLITALLASYLLPLQKVDPFLKGMLRFLFKLLFIKIETSGSEHIVAGKTYIFMVNHVSLLDIPLVGGFVPGFLRGIEASSQHKWPLYGLVMGRLGNIPIERENVHASLSVVDKALTMLKSGVSIVVFPEGGRSLDGTMKVFKKLPFHLAKKSSCDLIPIGISGMFERNNRNSFKIRPGKVTLRIGEAISGTHLQQMETLEIRDMVRKTIQNLVESETPES